MTLTKLIEIASNKNNFSCLENYIDFACAYLEDSPPCLQSAGFS